MESLQGESKEVFEYAMSIFKDHKTTDLWFASRLAVLEGACPHELLATKAGCETIMVVLRKIDHGEFIA